ncbi:hypothetical protein [Paenibacillus sp. BJ-4]|uniref:hypothetical protein n=1 Tax=Paenibacillus sp. BJ-4 TaxID=2878097 RepID=UPI0039A45BA3
MRKLLMFLLIAPMVVISACSQDKPEKKDNLVFVEGGNFQNNKSNNSGKIVNLSNFYIIMLTRSHGIGKTPETNTYLETGTGLS